LRRYERISPRNFKKSSIGKPNSNLERIDDREVLKTKYDVAITKVVVWTDKMNICGIQFFYEHFQKIFPGNKMVVI